MPGRKWANARLCAPHATRRGQPGPALLGHDQAERNPEPHADQGNEGVDDGAWRMTGSRPADAPAQRAVERLLGQGDVAGLRHRYDGIPDR